MKVYRSGLIRRYIGVMGRDGTGQRHVRLIPGMSRYAFRNTARKERDVRPLAGCTAGDSSRAKNDIVWYSEDRLCINCSTSERMRSAVIRQKGNEKWKR